MLPLAASELDVCGMACCVAEGHCCCARRKTFCQGHVSRRGWAASHLGKGSDGVLSAAMRSARFRSTISVSKAPIVKYAGEVDVAAIDLSRTPALRARRRSGRYMQPPALRHSPSSEQFSLITVIRKSTACQRCAQRQAQVRPKSILGIDASVCASCSA